MAIGGQGSDWVSGVHARASTGIEYRYEATFSPGGWSAKIYRGDDFRGTASGLISNQVPDGSLVILVASLVENTIDAGIQFQL